ncbi:hypothetical protein GGR16_000747 [Chelatococcus caeni]|uniref:Uncharacterized protein n=1 Tax=Chelatococcus caeni TaxID=1348468 RepID=A0A840BQK0_9HYPH|nr:hypothetical protein [Chelatococcus caeni]
MCHLDGQVVARTAPEGPIASSAGFLIHCSF